MRKGTTREWCSYPGCDRKRYVRGYCTQHYRQLKAGGPLKPLRAYARQPAECRAEGCPGKPHGRGYCKVHLGRLSRYGRLERVNAVHEPGQACSVDGCDGPVRSLGYCLMHYMRVVRTGSAGQAERIAYPRRKSKYAGVACAVEGCERPVKALGWCPMHYHRYNRTGDPVGKWGAGPRKSEGYITSDGYRMITRDGRKILEHRAVLAEVIGRPLERFEDAHHKNGIRDDNRPGNLELWVHQPRGQRVSDLLEFVVAHYRGEMVELLAAG